MTDLTLHHQVPWDRRVAGDCVWCGNPSVATATTPGRPDVGRVPLHLTCGPLLRDAFRAWQSGMALPVGDQMALGRLRRAQIESGR